MSLKYNLFKVVLFAVIFLLSESAIGQDSLLTFNLTISGRVSNEDTNKKMKNVDVVIEQDSIVVGHTITKSFGKFSIQDSFLIEKPLLIKFTTNDFVTKIILLDVSKSCPKIIANKNNVYDLNINLFKPRKGIDYGILNELPIAIFGYDCIKMDFYYDDEASKVTMQRIENQMQKEQ